MWLNKYSEILVAQSRQYTFAHYIILKIGYTYIYTIPNKYNINVYIY
jgi:hypothetical protein